MSDNSTTMMIRRRVRNWKTTVSGIAAIVCPIISLFLPPEWAAKLLAASSILAGSGLITAADATASEAKGTVVEVADKFKTRIGRLPLPLLALILALPLTTGCISNGGLAKLATQLARDPATVSVRLTTVYGTLYFTRTNPGTNTLTHTVSPDGTVSVSAAVKP